MESLEVIASFDWLEKEETVGTISHEILRGGSVYTFEYSRDWLKKHPEIMLSKDLQPFEGAQYAREHVFGFISDTLPDF